MTRILLRLLHGNGWACPVCGFLNTGSTCNSGQCNR
jgi:hypothetical protein